MYSIVAHASDVAITEVPRPSLLDSLTHQPIWLSLIIIIFILFGVYALLEKLRVRPLNRLIAMLPLAILIAIIYLQHNSAVATVVLIVGFMATFFLAFTQMKGPDKTDKMTVTKEVPKS